jgi:membrane protease YdiL (CAAX protease family)
VLVDRPWKVEPIARLILGIVASLALGMLAASLASRWIPETFPIDKSLVLMAVHTLALHGAILFWVHLFVQEHQISWNEAFGFSEGSKGRVMLLGVAAAVATLPIILALQLGSAFVMKAFSWEPVAQNVVQQIQEGGTLDRQIFFFIVAVILAPVAEEILFRGVLYPSLRRMGYPRVALLGTSFLFAAIHYNAATFIPLMVLALVLTFLYERTNNLLASIACHSCFNCINFTFLMLQKYLPNFPGSQ